jgi:hypothetical protein
VVGTTAGAHFVCASAVSFPEVRSVTTRPHRAVPPVADRYVRSSVDGQAPPVADGAAETAIQVENTHLRAQLASMPVIEQAKGILMVRYQISADVAFALLQRWSSHTNVKLRDISRWLVDAATTPDPPTARAPGPCSTALERVITDLINSPGQMTRRHATQEDQ